MASPAISIKIDGDKELMAEFNRMSKGLGKQALAHATLQGANVIKREASLRAPRGRTGNLRRGIIAKVLKAKKQLASAGVSWTVSGGDKSPFYGLFIEKGTKQRNTGKVRRDAFLIPAYDAKRRQAADVIKKELWRIIMKLKKRGMAGG